MGTRREPEIYTGLQFIRHENIPRRECSADIRLELGNRRLYVRHEDDHPVVEEFELSLRIAAGRGIWRGTTLVMTAHFAVAYFRLRSQVVVV